MRRSLRCVAVTMFLGVGVLSAQSTHTSKSAQSPAPAVTAVAGESWLNHLNRSFGDSSMGKTGRLGPPASESDEPGSWQPVSVTASADQTITLRGSDLYRLNCQGCHGEAGLGAPPEINSVIDPVRATSVSLVIRKMKKRGMEITAAAAAELAKQAQDALLQRLHQGGQNMPPFPHLSEAEIRALIAYLKQLAGVPGAAQLSVTESPVRVGEHIVKSTCHTCHDATGPNPTPQQLEDGAIPPLQTLTRRTDEVQLIRKVTRGAPILMGTPPTLHRGRMPVFYYLTDNEAADVYLYLTLYPPSSLASTAGAMAVRQPPQAPANPSSSGAVTPQAPGTPESSPSSGIPDWCFTLLLIGAGWLAAALVGAGVVFVAYQLCRLGRDSAYGNSQPAALPHVEREADELVAR